MSFVNYLLQKGEPEWMLEFRLKSLEIFNKDANARLGEPDLSDIDFDEIDLLSKSI